VNMGLVGFIRMDFFLFNILSRRASFRLVSIASEKDSCLSCQLGAFLHCFVRRVKVSTVCYVQVELGFLSLPLLHSRVIVISVCVMSALY
jgi:hypothetical protein